jgi:acetyl esterase
MIYFLDAYLGEDWTTADAYAMPAKAADLSNLPPTLVHTAEIDPLRDEGKIFAERLAQAGVPVTYRCAQRMIHSFIRTRFQGPGAAAEFAVITDFLKENL